MPRYEFRQGSSNKFWDITLRGKSFTTTYGKIGANGQTTIKKFASDATAQAEYEKLVAEKVKKGYQPAGGAAAPAPAASGKRYFESGDKFWEVFLDGNSVKTRFGKQGAAGQMRLKDFKSKSAAQADLETQVAKKIKEGFAEGALAPAKAAAASRVRAPNGKRYLENGDQFWEARAHYGTLKIRFGKQGTRGESQSEGFKTEELTRAGLERWVAKKLKEGFTEQIGPVVITSSIEAKSNPGLEKAIVANPGDADAYMVYADWLQDQGDPRGELIALQTGGKKAAAKKLFDANVDYFLGPLQAHQICYDDFSDEKKEAFHWKNGFIHAVRLAHNHHADHWDGKLATEVVAPLLKHPSGRFIVELTINENDDPTDDTLDDIFTVIAKHGMPTLRKLRIGDDISQISWYRVGNLGKLWKAIPNLTHFDIEAGAFTLGTIELPNLVHAVFRTGGLSKQAAKSIATATWPKIERLEVYFGDENYGGDCTPKDVAPLLDRTDLPKLTYLGVKNAEFQNDLVPYLAKSKLVKQLTTLDISEGILTDEAVDAFLAHADAFKHLVLDVSSTYLSKDALEKLKGVAKKLVADDMRDDDDPEYRYVCVGE